MDRLPLKRGPPILWSRWLRQVDDTIRLRALFSGGQKILVAVSGGLDSMVLLRTLHHLAKTHQWKLAVAHFNHQLRGTAALADEKLVRATAAALRLPIVVGRGNVRAAARVGGISLEMAGRRLRHHFLARAARRLRIPVIALAHHADDQVELFFLRLFRGTGAQGLAGMNWSNPSPEDRSILLARPFLNQSKETLATIARESAVEFSDDATNLSLETDRNRVRNELLPLLRRHYQPRLTEAVLRLMELAGADAAVIATLAANWLRAPDEHSFDSLPVAVQRRVLQLQLHQLGQAAEFDLVERLRRAAGRPFALNQRQTVSRDAAGALHLQELQVFQFDSSRKRLRFSAGQGRVQFAGHTILWKLKAWRSAARGQIPSPASGLEYFDAGKVGAAVCLRHWQPGDRFQPIGAASPRKLQDLFINLKVPRADRHRRIVATTSKNDIFWVEGLRIGENFKLDAGTVRVLEWKIG
jgi:tRNA(Ile)-lysidine synthase